MDAPDPHATPDERGNTTTPTPRANAGDPARTLALLWRDPAAIPRRGPARMLDLDAVVDAAVALADANGLAAVSMRRLAAVLGIAPMSLYTYIPSRAELLDLMLDRVYATMPNVPPVPSHPWRERLASVARENWALCRTHRWLPTVATTRPGLGPGATAKYDRELAAFDGLGLADTTVDDALTLVLTFVRASALAAIESDAAATESTASDAEWWETVAPHLANALDPERFPRAVRVGSAAGNARGTAYDPGHAFEFGLARILDGLADFWCRVSGLGAGNAVSGPQT
jgi:AcrR family transcriptional regulator